MANRFYSPNQQFADATGLPYAGGSLAFYASGTSTPLATYSDSALTIANTNPVVLDSAGRAGNIFLQNLTYKVVLSDINNNPIWTDDPVYSSDYSTRAKLLSGSGSPNGNTAGTAGSASIGADTYWDATNNILYVCTQTGSSSTAVWTAVNAGSATNVVLPPQGYLTITSGTPVIPGDATAQTAVYYTPFIGNLTPIYNGTSFVPTVFSELQLSLVSAHASNTIYDLFVFNNSGVLTLATGPAWNVSAGGSSARGTGAGTTQISRLNGLWVNTVSMTGRNGSTTYTIAANQGTYVGSIYIDGSAGQVSCYRTAGQSRKWGLWNAYNRVPVTLQVSDPTAAWNSAPTSFRISRGDTSNFAMTFSGLAEEIYTAQFTQAIAQSASSSTCTANIGIGVNSSTVITGTEGFAQINASASVVAMVTNARANLQYQPSLGINQFSSLEVAPNGTTNNSFRGGVDMQMSVTWRA